MGRVRLTDSMPWNEVVEHITNRLMAYNPKLPRKDFIKWYGEKQDVGFPFDPHMVYQCYKAHRRAKKDYDNFWAFCGQEGSGKSTIARNAAYMIDPNFSEDKIVFTLDEYMNLLRGMLERGEKGGAIVIDEGGQLMFSRDAMSATNKILVRTAMMQRKLNLTVIICIPNFFLLDSYPRDSRVNLLIQISKRGEYKGILKEGITKVSRDGVKYKNVLTVNLPLMYYWKGTFNTTIPKGFDLDSYEAKKDKYMKLYFEEATQSKVEKSHGVKMSILARRMGAKPSHLQYMINQGKLKAYKINKTWFITRDEIKKKVEEGLFPAIDGIY
jgi:energy-coupling factor transporter ATP-binding protein EcfA2